MSIPTPKTDPTSGPTGRLDLLMRPADVAQRLGVAVETVARYGRAGQLQRVVLPSGAIRYKAADVENLVNGMPVAPVADAPVSAIADTAPKCRHGDHPQHNADDLRAVVECLRSALAAPEADGSTDSGEEDRPC